MHVPGFDMMTYVKEATMFRDDRSWGNVSAGRAGVCGGRTFKLWHGMELLAWCERALKIDLHVNIACNHPLHVVLLLYTTAMLMIMVLTSLRAGCQMDCITQCFSGSLKALCMMSQASGDQFNLGFGFLLQDRFTCRAAVARAINLMITGWQLYQVTDCVIGPLHVVYLSLL